MILDDEHAAKKPVDETQWRLGATRPSPHGGRLEYWTGHTWTELDPPANPGTTLESLAHTLERIETKLDTLLGKRAA